MTLSMLRWMDKKTETLASFPLFDHLVVINQNREALNTVLRSINNLAVNRSPSSKNVPFTLRGNELLVIFTHVWSSFRNNLLLPRKRSRDIIVVLLHRL